MAGLRGRAKVIAGHSNLSDALAGTLHKNVAKRALNIAKSQFINAGNGATVTIDDIGIIARDALSDGNIKTRLRAIMATAIGSRGAPCAEADVANLTTLRNIIQNRHIGRINELAAGFAQHLICPARWAAAVNKINDDLDEGGVGGGGQNPSQGIFEALATNGLFNAQSNPAQRRAFAERSYGIKHPGPQSYRYVASAIMGRAGARFGVAGNLTLANINTLFGLGPGLAGPAIIDGEVAAIRAGRGAAGAGIRSGERNVDYLVLCIWLTFQQLVEDGVCVDDDHPIPAGVTDNDCATALRDVVGKLKDSYQWTVSNVGGIIQLGGVVGQKVFPRGGFLEGFTSKLGGHQVHFYSHPTYPTVQRGMRLVSAFIMAPEPHRILGAFNLDDAGETDQAFTLIMQILSQYAVMDQQVWEALADEYLCMFDKICAGKKSVFSMPAIGRRGNIEIREVDDFRLRDV